MDMSRIEHEMQQTDWHIVPPSELRDRCLPTEPISTTPKHWRIKPISGFAGGAVAAAVIVGFALWANSGPRTAFAAERAFDQAETSLGTAQRLVFRQTNVDHPDWNFVVWVDRKLGYRMEIGDTVRICDLSGGHLHCVKQNPQRVLTLDWAKPETVKNFLQNVGYDTNLQAARNLAEKRNMLVKEQAIDEANGAIWRVSVGDQYTVDFDDHLRVVRMQRGAMVETYEYPATLDPSLFAEPEADIPRIAGAQREVQQCMHNLKDLSYAMYIYFDKHGSYPATLADLPLESESHARLRHCPGSSLTTDTEYVLYHPQQIEPVAPLVECRAHGAVRVVAFTDGHVEVLPHAGQ